MNGGRLSVGGAGRRCGWSAQGGRAGIRSETRRVRPAVTVRGLEASPSASHASVITNAITVMGFASAFVVAVAGAGLTESSPPGPVQVVGRGEMLREEESDQASDLCD